MSPADSALRAVVIEAARAGRLDPEQTRRALTALAQAATQGGAAAALRASGLPRSVVEWLIGQAASTRTGTPDPPPGDRSRSSSYSSILGHSNHYPPGSRVGPFTVERELGRGGMGVVLRARDDAGRPVALKLVLASRPASLERFSREVSALAALDHPNVVRYLGSGGEPVPWLAMELIEGEDLDQRLDRVGRLAPDAAARVVAEVARGIAHAHEKGIVHRDLKPSNILLRSSGEAVVSDFGLARDLDASRFTKTGALVGTLTTMAPEQVRGERAGPPADVWALGVVLFKCLTGRSPFGQEETLLALTAAIVHQRIPSPRSIDPRIPEDLDATCRACLERDPARRPTARQVARALRDRRPPTGERRGRRPRAALAAGAATALALVAVPLALLGGSPPDEPPPAATASAAPPPADEAPDAPGDGWTVAWALDGALAPQVEAPALWDEPGRVAAPLDRVRDDRPGARAAGLAGRSRDAGAGRIAVTYGHDALSAWPKAPALYVASVAAPYALLVPADDAPGAAWLRSANDSSAGHTWVGAAHWREAAVSLRWRRRAHEDGDDLYVSLGAGQPERRTLGVNGRGGVLRLGDASAPLGPLDEWRRLRFAPGAAPGTRVVLDDEPVPTLDVVVPEPAAPGRVVLETSEISVVVADVQVEGRLLRPDRPALAWAPVDLPVHARVTASFERALDEGVGGPLVTLGAPTGARYTLELARGTLILRRGERVMAARADARLADVRAGTLVLERRAGDVVRGVALAGELELAIERVDPLPLPGWPPRAGWGSGAARASFSRVEVHTGPDDPTRRALDQAAGDGLAAAVAAVEGAPADDPVCLWRRGALSLARVVDPEWFDPALAGRARDDARHAHAAEAARTLQRAIERGLEGPAACDARVRAVLAHAVAADAPGAEAAARRAVEVLGLEAARAWFDGLELPLDAAPGQDRSGGLLERFVDGFFAVYYPAGRVAALAAAEVLAPEHLGLILARRAAIVRALRLDPRSEAGRRAYDEALRLFDRARAAGADPSVVEGPCADALMDVGRWEEALAAWERARAHHHDWWLWVRRGMCLAALGRGDEALESYLGALVRAPARGDVLQLVAGALDGSPPPGLTAVALLALHDATGGDRQGSFVKVAEMAARDGAGAPGRDGDLARYALVRLGLTDDPGPPSMRPTAVLARARAGAADARDALAAAAREDPLVEHLAGLDPLLRTLLGR